jgi:hypothetical protein
MLRSFTKRSFRAGWIKGSGAIFAVSAATLSLSDSWLVQIGLIITLVLLLVSGISIVVVGISDLIRNYRRLARESHKSSQ